MFMWHPAGSGVMMAITRMEMDTTGGPRLRVVDGGMPGRAMARQSGCSWGRQVVLSRGLLVQLIASEAGSVATVVAAVAEGVVTALGSIILLLMRRWCTLGLRSQGYLARLWRWSRNWRRQRIL